MPAEWWERAEPFRGTSGVRLPELDAEAPDRLIALLAPHRSRIDAIVALTRGKGKRSREIAEAARVSLDSPSEATPLGAAAVAAILDDVLLDHRSASDPQHVRLLDCLVDSWIVLRGLTFAAEAAVARRGLKQGGNHNVGGWLAAVAGDEVGYGELEIGYRVRARLAWAADDEHRRAVERLAELRSGAVWVRLGASYLAPEQQAWVDADLTLPLRAQNGFALHLMVTTLSTPSQFARYIEITQARDVLSVRGGAHLFNVLTQIGSGAARFAIANLQSNLYGPAAIEILARIPTDEAFESIMNKLGPTDDALHVVREAAERYPRRAMRILSHRAAEIDDRWGRWDKATWEFLRHAVSYPQLRSEPGVDPIGLKLLESSGLPPHMSEIDVASAPLAPGDADIDGVVEIARLAAEFDWTWADSDAERFAAAAGWASGLRRSNYIYFTATLNGESSSAMARVDYLEETLRARFGRGGTYRENPPLKYLSLGFGPRGTRSANAIVAATQRLTAEFGPAALREPGYQSIRWELPNLIVELSGYENACLQFTNPAHQELEDYVNEADLRYDADNEVCYCHDEPECGCHDDDCPNADSDDDTSCQCATDCNCHCHCEPDCDGDEYGDSDCEQPCNCDDTKADDPITVVNDWPAFTSGLTEVLTRLRRRTGLTLRVCEHRYVNFSIEQHILDCTVPGNHQLPEPFQLDSDQRARLARRGWFGCEGIDWGHRIPFPSTHEHYRHAAETAVAVLRECFGATEPAALTIETGADIGFIDLEPLESDNHRQDLQST